MSGVATVLLLVICFVRGSGVERRRKRAHADAENARIASCCSLLLHVGDFLARSPKTVTENVRN